MLKNLLVAFAVSAVSVSGSAYAQMDISIDFDDGTAGSLIETGRIAGLADNPTVGGGVITFPPGNDAGRVIFGTTETNVMSQSFVASVDILYPGTTNNSAFFGVGAGETDGNAGGGSFGEPSNGPAVYAVFGNANNFFGHVASPESTGTIASNSGIGLAENELGETPKLVFADTEATGIFTTVTLTHDAEAQTLVFESPTGASEVIRTDEHTYINGDGVEVTREAIQFGSDNSRIFIGGSGSTQFDNLSVVFDTGGTGILGDFDMDGDVDLADLDQYNGNIGAVATGALAALDLDENGTVDAADFQQHYTDLVETSNGQTGTFAGDVNLDGIVNVLGDAFALVGNLNNAATSWSQGDLNADGSVNVLGDAFALVGNLGNTNEPAASPATSAVPEPGSLSLLALVGMSAAMRRRR